MKILVICGSLRKNSLTRVLTDLVYAYAQEKYPNAQVEYIDVGKYPIDNFRGYEEEYSPKTKEATDLVENSEVLIIGSPVYNGLLSSQIKNLFEHANYKATEGHVAGFICQSSGTISSLQVQGQLTALMTYFRIISNPRAVFSFRDKHIDRQGKLLDEKVPERIRQLVDETVALFYNRPKE